MIDLSQEELIPFKEFSLEIGKDIHRVRCWARGIRTDGIDAKLDSVLIGGRRYTSWEAYYRFVEIQNPGQPPWKEKDFIPIHDLAKMIGKSRRTVYAWCATGILVPGEDCRVKLDSRRICGWTHTSENAYRQFVLQQNPSCVC